MNFWYKKTFFAWLLYPFALIFRAISMVRRGAYRLGLLKSYKSPLPVIVVGNISVGGNGKTPFVIWLSSMLIKQGYKPGVISRGYGGKSDIYPLLIDPNVTGSQAGDEPVLIFKRLGIPVCVDPIRKNAAAFLTDNCDVDIIITDDGLQHYALERSIEIVVVDGVRRFGNGHLIPMGPLREPLSRLKTVDFIINNGGTHIGEIPMRLKPQACLPVDGRVISNSSEPLSFKINACAAIGYPQRFFDTLVNENFTLQKQIGFSDHHAFKPEDFEQFEEGIPLLMTEKDAVKCTVFAKPNWWYLPIEAKLPETFKEELLTKIKELKC